MKRNDFDSAVIASVLLTAIGIIILLVPRFASSPDGAAVFTAFTLLAGLSVLYPLLLRRLPIRWTLMSACLIAVPVFLFAFQPSTLSADFNDYLSCAARFVQGENPYRTLCNVPHDRGYAYGPVFLLVSGGAALGERIMEGVGWIILKSVVVAAYGLNAWLLYLLLRARFDRNQASFAVMLYAFNPVVLFESLQGGHNDVLVVTSVLTALVAYQRGTTFWSVTALVAGGLVKLIPLFLAPLVLLARLGRNISHGKAVLSNGWVARILARAIVVIALMLIALKWGPDFLRNAFFLTRGNHPVSFGVIPLLSYAVLQAVRVDMAAAVVAARVIGSTVFVAVYCVLCFRVLRRERSDVMWIAGLFAVILCLLLLTTGYWVVPWYLLWLYPFVPLLLPFEKIGIGMMLASAAGALSIAVPVSFALILLMLAAFFMRFAHSSQTRAPFFPL